MGTSSGTANSASSDASGGPGVLSEIHMAKDNGSGDPGDRAVVFSPGDRTIHCVAKLKEAKSGTGIKFSWWIVSAEGTQNEKIKDIDYTTKALENIVHAHLKLPRDWPKGMYKVEIYVNGYLDKTAQYSVQ